MDCEDKERLRLRYRWWMIVLAAIIKIISTIDIPLTIRLALCYDKQKVGKYQ
jgi:hypothetical protein